MLSFSPGSEKGITAGVIYVFILLSLGAYLNYAMPYDGEPVESFQLAQIVVWGFLYLPLFVWVIAADWQVARFGFLTTRRTLFVVLGLALLFGASVLFSDGWRTQTTVSGIWIESFARTGEELFFRGFLFLLLLKIFQAKERPWLWAAVISSLLFAVVHTQIFQSDYLAAYGSGPAVYRIFSRLFNVFLIALLFALLRQWTQSILPGALIHSYLQAGIFTLPACLLIYAAIALWAYARGEVVWLAPGAKAPPQ